MAQDCLAKHCLIKRIMELDTAISPHTITYYQPYTIRPSRTDGNDLWPSFFCGLMALATHPQRCGLLMVAAIGTYIES